MDKGALPYPIRWITVEVSGREVGQGLSEEGVCPRLIVFCGGPGGRAWPPDTLRRPQAAIRTAVQHRPPRNGFGEVS